MGKNSHIKNEVLRYLGYKDRVIDKKTDALIDESIEEIKVLSKERYTYRFYDIADKDGKVSLKDSILILPGRDISKQLEGSQTCVLIAASLGHQVDTRIR